MILALDMGNTRVKAGLFADGQLIETWNESGSKALDAIIIALRERGSLIKYVGVAGVGDLYMQQVKEAIQIPMPQATLMEVNAAMPLPFNLRYSTPKTLGADRIAAVAGALADAKKGPLLAITAGTALTMNFLNSENEFEGGSISPGLQMRFRALNEFTARLPMVTPAEDPQPLTGESTEASIRVGVQRGMATEVAGMVADFREKFGAEMKVYLTGGDALFLANHLKNTTFVDLNLQLKGIYFLLTYPRVHD